VWADEALRGAACWLPPGETQVSVLRALRTGALGLPARLGPRGLRRLLAYEAVAEAQHEQGCPEPHWYLYLLGVDPDAQGEGIARRLVAPALERADADGVPAYLETQTPGNVALYERFGFAVTGQRDVAPGLVTIGMRREPR
jgi:ribosomal protein S18 acetylase RimI-like enzyme